MAYTTINKSSDYFNTLLYAGNNTDGRAITGVGFQPDWVWIKGRNAALDNEVFDPVRGATKYITTNATNVEATNSNRLQSFDTDGFTLGDSTSVNKNYNYVSWNWRAGNSSGSSNSDGTITSTVSANTTSGFSIVKWTGSGSNATIGHGLGVAPKLVITKSLASSQEWCVGSDTIGWGNYLFLNETSASQSGSSYWQSTAPTSTVFSVGTVGPTNSSAGDLIAYCFAEIQGFSKIGSYVANGSNNGAFCYTGFKPGFIMIKSSTTAMYWHIFDNKRLGYNAYNYRLNPNANEVETTTTDVIDILSNGFKIRTNQQQFGTSGATYIYMAFAEAPIVGSNNVPAVAK